MHDLMVFTPRRILYVITDLEIGGVPLHLCRLATSMHELGHVVRVVSLSPPGPVSKMIAQAGVEVGSCDARSAAGIGALLRLRREIVQFQPEIIHSFLFHANIACRLTAPLAGVTRNRLICEIQTVEIERRWHLTVDRWTHRLCWMEIGNSQSVIDHLHHEAGLPESRLMLVRGGVDLERFDQAKPIRKSELGAKDRDSLLAWVGRLDSIKGLDDLLRALAIIRQRFASHLVLVGDGPERSRLEQLITELDLADRVSLVGVRDDVPEILKACDVFVFPSHAEGMPNALLEAMAAGCAIVCTDVPGNRDLITDGRTGLTVPVMAPDALAEAVMKLLASRDLTNRLGAAASTLAKESFDSKLVTARYLKIYDTI
ncbi:MAG: glycosyltransferase [Planctomycetota bacterium]|nr:glycosyltransferase [Planctomycetota bacterium]